MILLTSFIGFHSPTYEHVITRKMRFQSGPCNPTEALIGMQLFCVITSIYPSIWSYDIPKNFLIFLFVPILFVSSIISFLSSLNQIYIHHKYILSTTIKSIFIGYSSLFFVIICSFIYILHISEFYKEHSLLCLIAMTIPWNYSIYRTIIIEITDDKNFDTFGLLFGQTPILIPVICSYLFPSFHMLSIIISIILSGILYIYTVHFTLKEVCHALSMEHFWIVKKDSFKNKA
jgi:hypothetical protein